MNTTTFSWNTSTGVNNPIAEPILVKEHNPSAPVVYLIQPNDVKPLSESNYKGDGVFDGVDAFDWLADNNLPEHAINTFYGQKRELGLGLMNAFYYESTTGEYFAQGMYQVLCSLLVSNKTMLINHLNTLVVADGISSSVQEHINDGRLFLKSLSEHLRYPLKFSFDELAKYDDLDRASLSLYANTTLDIPIDAVLA